MSDFHAAYPEYAATSVLDELRASEYGYLDERGHVYLDYTGAGLAARSQLRASAARLRSGCYGNPHSDNPASSASTRLVERARAAILRYFNATAEDYAVIFTPNATGACKLVAEAYPFRRRTRLVLTADNHNSVNGIREFAKAAGARVSYVPLTGPELRISEDALSAALSRGHGLFAYPAQSNFSGVLTNWLLDSLGTLRHSNGAPMVRRYGPGPGSGVARGGTVTFNFLDPDGHLVDERAVGRDASAAGISLRTGCFCNPGAGEWAFGLTGANVRGPWRARALGGQRFLREGLSTVDDYLSLIGLPTGGAVRVSLGIASTLADVDAFLDFAERTYRDRTAHLAGLPPRLSC
jgi:selenocysteine lyase/cysteine desulfurase